MKKYLLHSAKKSVIMVLVLVLIAFASGCSGGSLFGGSKSNNDVNLIDDKFRKGFDGLQVSFAKNAPPDKVFEDTRFPIAIYLTNNGATDIGTNDFGYLSLGLEKAYVSLENNGLDSGDDIDRRIIENLEGKKAINPNGGQEFIEAVALAKKVGAQSETHPSTIFVTACYSYKTILGADICVDTDLYGLGNRQKVCTAKDLTYTQGQGGPVAITKVEVRMFPAEDDNRVIPHFILHVENKGNGEVLLKKRQSGEDVLDLACGSGALQYTDFNRIKVIADLGNDRLNCRVGEAYEAILRLRDKKDVIRCTLDQGIPKDRDPYTAPLKVELEYGYTFTVTKDIIIEKILKY